MATKREAKKRIPNYPSLFPELEGGAAYEDSLNASKKPRRRLNSYKVGRYKDTNQTSRERRNKKLWASLYPTPKR